MSRSIAYFFTALLIALAAPLQAQNPKFGKFSGNPKTEWLDDGRNMILLEDFTYTDGDGTKWTAKKASVHRPPDPGDLQIDGASIPPIFWSIVGGPFEGRYRNASIVHDAECVAKKHGWKQVHRMFYNGMLAGNTEPKLAKMMYAAVYHFGPRWRMKLTDNLPSPELHGYTDAMKLLVYVMNRPEISIEAIEAITSEVLATNVNDEDLENFRNYLDDLNSPTGSPYQPLLGEQVPRRKPGT
jgi:hypothetical protein